MTRSIIYLMHSWSSRFNLITLYTGLVLALMCTMNFLQGWYMYNPTPQISFQLLSSPFFVKTPNWEQVTFRYDMEADLNSLYNWDLKQLFVYIEVEWKHPVSNLSSRAIVADWILSTPLYLPSQTNAPSKTSDSLHISIKDRPFEYSIRDVHKGLLGAQLTISVNVEYMPIVGPFFKTRLMETKKVLPTAYSR